MKGSKEKGETCISCGGKKKKKGTEFIKHPLMFGTGGKGAQDLGYFRGGEEERRGPRSTSIPLAEQ